MTEKDTAVMDAARLWMFRVNDPGFDNWDGLTAWLEADPRHLAAYESALEEDEWAAELAAGAAQSRLPLGLTGASDVTTSYTNVQNAANANAHFNANAPANGGAQPPVRRKPWLAFGGAIAAALAAVGGWTVMSHAPGGNMIVTAPGEHMSIDLADGTRIALNGDTRISYDPKKPRMVTVERGEALFEVHHDAEHPFVVMAGETRLIDAGTVFNVVREGEALEVGVAEGAVIFDAARQPIRLEPGDAVARATLKSKPELRRIEPSAVGSWQKGLLQYDNAQLPVIARDIARSIGKPVRVTSAATRIRYSGTIAVEGSPQDVMARAAPLLGVKVSEGSDAWEMMPSDGSSR